MGKIIISLILASALVFGIVYLIKSRDVEPDRLEVLKEQFEKRVEPTVDHSKLPALQKKFSTPQEVTKTCISCHTEAPKQIMKSNHWNWERAEYIKGRGIVYLGKKNAVNNFCIGIEGNEKSCGKCHIGFGVTDNMKAFTDSTNIDCLVCHDNTETYAKAPEKGGLPLATLDFNSPWAEYYKKPLENIIQKI